MIKWIRNNYNYITISVKYHGVGGPLTVTPKSWSSSVAKVFIEAGKELGYPHVDPNAQNQKGIV